MQPPPDSYETAVLPMDMEVYEQVCDQEQEDCEELCRIREQIASQLEF